MDVLGCGSRGGRAGAVPTGNAVRISKQQVPAVSVKIRVPSLQLGEGDLVCLFDTIAPVPRLDGVPRIARVRGTCKQVGTIWQDVIEDFQSSRRYFVGFGYCLWVVAALHLLQIPRKTSGSCWNRARWCMPC